MIKFIRSAIFIAIVLISILPAWSPVYADETPTPTPLTQYVITLSSGGELVVKREITYGEIALVIAILVLIVIFLIYLFVRVPKLWI